MSKLSLMYFGHPISFYNLPMESKLVEAIQKKFPGYELVNPNQPAFQEGYQKWKRETGNGMNFYFKEILPSVTAGTFLAFPEDLKFGKGVWGEAEFISSRNGPIYEIRLDLQITPLALDPARMLSVEDTVKRVYEADRKTIRKWTAQGL